jgi:hypothetical protein
VHDVQCVLYGMITQGEKPTFCQEKTYMECSPKFSYTMASSGVVNQGLE